MNLKEFTKRIAQLVDAKVERELAKRVPIMVESILTKRYLNDLISEKIETAAPLMESRKKVKKKPTSVREAMEMDEDEEETPGQYANTDKGIYQKDPLTSKYEGIDFSRVISKLSNGDSGVASFFEGTTPTSHYNDSSIPSAEIVPEEALNKAFDMERMKLLAEKTINSNRGRSVNPEILLEQHRKKLDERVVGASAAPTNFEVDMPQIRNVFPEEDPFEAKMREMEMAREHRGI